MRIENSGDRERTNMAYRIYQRYRNNSQKSKSWDNEYQRALAMENDNIDGARSIVSAANSRQYSRNTYMGLNNG